MPMRYQTTGISPTSAANASRADSGAATSRSTAPRTARSLRALRSRYSGRQYPATST